MTSKGDPKGGGGARSLAELHALGVMKRMPSSMSLDSTEPVRLPSVEAPSLEGLTVALEAPEPLTEEELVDRFESLRRAHAERRERKAGEAVALEDEVLLDVLGFADGRLLPFSARENWWADVVPDPLLPGFFESLVGAVVGQSFGIELKLPDTHPAEALRGHTARFLVDVKAARELKLLAEDSPELLKRLGGATLTDVLQRLAEELARERVEEMERLARERVLDLLVERARVDLPPALVDEEIRRQWAEAERPLLVHKDFQPDELQEALDGWLKDPLTRAAAEWRLNLALVLRAIAMRDGVRPERSDTEAVADDLAALAGVSLQELGHTVRADPALERRFQDLALHLATIDHVLKRVKLTPPAA